MITARMAAAGRNAADAAADAAGEAPANSAPGAVLLDVNVLVALAWPNHIHHDAAVRWFEDNHRAGWATAPFTQSGFVRVSSNHKIVPGARTPTEAIGLLRELTALPGHEFWTDDIAITASAHVDTARIIGHRQVTDAHLVALTLRNRGRLATFDAGLAEVVPSTTSSTELLVVLQRP